MQFESPRFQGDQLLLDILNDPDTGNLKLGPGSPPESVMRLQAALFDMNWTVEAGVTTSDGFPHTPATFVIGIYGPATKTTVLTYKRNYDLHFPPSAPTGFIDDFAGPRTFRKLDPQCVGFDARAAAIEQKADDLRNEGHSVTLFTSTTVPTTRPVLKSNGVRRAADDLDGDIAIFYCDNLGFGAFEVHGLILDDYLRRGSAGGPLGFPISDVHEDDPGFLRSDFERGALLLDVSSGSVTLIPPLSVPPSPGATLF